MKSWVFWVCTVVGAYLIYQSWFAPDQESEETENTTATASEDASAQASGSGQIPGTADAVVPLRVDPAVGTGAPGATPELPNGAKAPGAGPSSGRGDGSMGIYREWEALIGRADHAAAASLATRVLRERKNSTAALRIQLAQGRDALRAFRQKGRNKAGLADAQRARRLLTAAVFDGSLSLAERERLRVTLDDLANATIFGRRHIEGVDFLYTPQRGDNLERLCRRTFKARGASTSPGFVVEINGMRSAMALRAGEAIRVPLGKAEIRVVKSEYRLYFLMGGAYVRSFRVGLGRDGLTPEAEFIIQSKMKNPDWYPGNGQKIPYGHPDNILGNRWLGFQNTPELRGFGIHGTSDPSSIGQSKSSGCVRVGQDDIMRIFEWSPRGTRVVITR